MKTKLTILFVFAATILFAQKNFTATLTGGTNYMFIPDSLNQNNLNSGEFAYQSGINFSFEFLKHLTIGTGISYTTLSWSESYPPDSEIIDFTINVQYTYKFLEVPVYIQFEPFNEKKLSPFIRAGISVTEIKAKTGKLLGTDPAGNEQNYFAQMFNYTFKGEDTFLREMHNVFFTTGLNFNFYKSFYAGVNGGIKRCFYYDFNDKRSNYVTSCNLTLSYKF